MLTERARAAACRRVGQDAVSVAQAATDLGVGWLTVMRAVTEFGGRILDAAWLDRAVTRLGVDETAFLAATARRHTQFVTGLVDLAPAGGWPGPAARRRRGPLRGGGDRLARRSGRRVVRRGAGRGPGPFRGYDNALRTSLPTAAVVLDAFYAEVLVMPRSA